MYEKLLILRSTSFYQSKPYIMKTAKFDNMEEEERAKAAFSTLYEGYVVDLIKALSKQVKFKYEMYIVADGAYGAYNEKTGKWNGMIADLINHVNFSKNLN